jgi:pimeloyl-ACP methyl ester carboxylesterase
MSGETPGVERFEYTPLPERIRDLPGPDEPAAAILARRIDELRDVGARTPDLEGATEQIDGISYTHHFIEAPGDSELIRWHYVECGSGEPIVFVHGVPCSWFMWHHQMSALSEQFRCISVDLKGYGQSDKRTGDYRQEGVAQQLAAALDAIGLDSFDAVGFDRGAVILDYLGAKHPARFRSYTRIAQHLYHFHPALAPQEMMFVNPETAAITRDPVRMVISAYASAPGHDIAEADLRREIQEFAWPQVGWAVPRYFNSSSFRKEWIDRRSWLMRSWTFPVLILQGAQDSRQPVEFYQHVEQWLPDGRVEFIDAGHFLVLETSAAVTHALARFLASLPQQRPSA